MEIQMTQQFYNSTKGLIYAAFHLTSEVGISKLQPENNSEKTFFPAQAPTSEDQITAVENFVS